MKVSTEQREPREAVLVVELDDEDVEPYLNQAYRQAVRRLAIPGFRKGKAPRHVVEQLYGRSYLLNQAMDTVLQEFTSKAVEDQGLDIGGAPAVSLEEFDPPSFTATVPLQPRVNLGDFESVRVPMPEVSVSEEQVDAMLEQLRTELAVWEPVDDSVQMDDLINLTIAGWVDEDGEQRGIVQSEETDYIPRPNTTFPIPGMDEALVGLPVGKPRAFDVEVPADFRDPGLSGKSAHFEATVHSIKRKKLADLDDEFAKGVGEGYASLDDLRDRLRGNLLEQEERGARSRHQNEALTKVVEGASIDISPLIVDHELERYVHGREEAIKAGQVSFQEYQEYLAWQGLSHEEVHEQARPAVEERLKRAHVLRAVALDQSFEATDDEVEQEVASIAEESSAPADEVRKIFDDPERRESIRRGLVTRKTLDYLSEIALRDGPNAAEQQSAAAPGSSAGAEEPSAAGGQENSGGS